MMTTPTPPVLVVDGPKLVRLGEMLEAVLEEVRAVELDDRACTKLRQAQERAVTELASAVPRELGAELDRLHVHLVGDVTRDELRITQAQLVGWLEGVLHGLQVAVAMRGRAEEGGAKGPFASAAAGH